MKKLSVLFAALFVLLSGEAFGFDRSNETSAQVYFSIPFGGQTMAEATPRLGLSAGTGRDFVGYTGHNDNFGTYSSTSALGGDPFTVARESFDFRLGIDGTTSLYLNGSSVDEQIKGLLLPRMNWKMVGSFPSASSGLPLWALPSPSPSSSASLPPILSPAAQPA